MLPYFLIGMSALATGIFVMSYTFKHILGVRKLLGPILALISMVMCAIGATITASSLNGNRVDANQLAIVSATETTKSDTVSLTTLKLSDGMIVTCKPTQAACQSASPGDIIVYTKYLHSSGFFVERSEVTFVTPGPASKR